MPTRRHVHTRNIRAEVFAREDGLWDVEAELVDTKARDFRLATGIRAAGEPIHHMKLRITIDTSLTLVDAEARSVRVPYPGSCELIEPEYRRLIGLNLMKNFRREVRERLGGVAGCTHMTELTDMLPTAAIQAFAGEVIRTRDDPSDDAAARADEAVETRPFQLDRCHALRSDGPAVAEFYPRWYRPAAAFPAGFPRDAPTAETNI